MSKVGGIIFIVFIALVLGTALLACQKFILN